MSERRHKIRAGVQIRRRTGTTERGMEGGKGGKKRRGVGRGRREEGGGVCGSKNTVERCAADPRARLAFRSCRVTTVVEKAWTEGRTRLSR